MWNGGGTDRAVLEEMRAEGVRWFAVWSGPGNVAYALDAWPEEVLAYAAEMRRDGQTFCGPYDDYEEALAVATAQLKVCWWCGEVEEG